MSKNDWIISKCKELDNNLFIETYYFDDILILENLENNNPTNLFEQLKTLNNIDYENYFFKITKRNTESGYYQNWHIDGKRVFETRKGIICQTNPENKSKYVLHDIYKPTPKYSILYYGSSYDIDFKGGQIEFINGKIIKPVKNQCIIFDSNLGHKVSLQTKGTRICYLIMLFEK
jgi:hypothetical protein